MSTLRNRPSELSVLLEILVALVALQACSSFAWPRRRLQSQLEKKYTANYRAHLQISHSNNGEWQWQQDAVEEALSAENTTAGLQLLVEAAGREQREQGKVPAVMITISNYEGMSTLMPLFVETLMEVSQSLASRLVVIAVSQQAFDQCKQHHLLCFYDKEADQRNRELAKAEGHSNLSRNKTPLFLQIGWDKLKRLQDALFTGSNILFADTDIVWLKHPLPLLEERQSDLQLTQDGWGPNIGVMYVRPSKCTMVFMQDWLARRNFTEARDQYEFPAAVESVKAKCSEFQVDYLDKDQFPNGCCCGNQFPSKIAEGQKWVLWHAACGGDLHSKKHHLQRILEKSRKAT